MIKIKGINKKIKLKKVLCRKNCGRSKERSGLWPWLLGDNLSPQQMTGSSLLKVGPVKPNSLRWGGGQPPPKRFRVGSLDHRVPVTLEAEIDHVDKTSATQVYGGEPQ